MLSSNIIPVNDITRSFLFYFNNLKMLLKIDTIICIPGPKIIII